MGRLTPQEIEELRNQVEGRGVKDPVERSDVRAPAESRDGINIKFNPLLRPLGQGLGKVWTGLDRATRLGALAAGTVAAKLPQSRALDRLIVEPIREQVPVLDRWRPPEGSTVEAFKAFWDEAGRGDLGAAIQAYEDEMDAGKWYWGTAELAGAALPTYAPAMAGRGLISASPKLARTIGGVLPATRGRVQARRGVMTGARWLGKGLKAPWEAEEAVARAAMRGIGIAARPLAQAVRKFRPAREGVEQAIGDIPVEDVIKADEILGPPQPPPLGFYAQIHRQRQNAIRALEYEYAKAKKRLLPWREQPLDQQKPRMQEDVMRDREFVETFDDRLASAKADERAARQAMETFVDPPKPFLVDDLTRGKKPPKRATRVEAERGPDGVNLDPMEGFEQVPKLGWWSGKVNAISEWTSGLIGKARRVDVEGVIETAKRVQASILSRAQSHASLARMFIRKGMRDNFTVDPKTGEILDEALQNRVRMSFNETEVVLQSPTIPDIAARYDTYEPFLTEGQKDFMRTLRNIVEDGTSWEVAGTKMSMPGWNKVMRDNMPEFAPGRIRPDITGNGFYLTRGATKRGKEVATSIADELEKMATFGRERNRGKIAAEQRARMPAMGKLVDVNGKVIPHVDTKTRRAIKYDSFEKTMEDYINGVAERVTDYRVKTKVRDLVKEYGGTTTIKKGRRGEQLIEGVDEADDALAAAISREFRTSLGKTIANLPLIRNVNNLYRGIKANFDLSAIGIHGSLAVFRAPKQWGQATGMVFKSLAATIRGRRGQEVVDEAIEKIDTDAVANGRLVARIWSSFGLRVGGTSVETALPGVERLLGQAGEGVRGRAAGIIGEGFQLSNRLFGSFGDVLRLRWADELLRQELAKGKTLENLARRGKDGISELDRIAKAANRLTGWSDKRFGGDMGEFSMFAARFFQARVETLGQSLGGVSRLARGQAQTIEQREALYTMVRMIGIGAFATELANAHLGNETDRRPIVDGRINSNFYTIRMGGRDFSVFGPTIGLLRAIGTLAVGVTEDPSVPGAAKAMADATRGLGSGVVRLMWDTFTGYGFRGKPAPIGLRRKDEAGGLVSDPRQLSEAMDILRYVGELALPIAPGAVGGELFEGVKSAREGDWERVVGAGAAAVAEAVGGRVTPLSRKDEAEELSQEKYGVPYETLTYQVQDEIDDLVTERMGEAGFYGSKGYLRKEKQETDDKLIGETQRIANKHLVGSPASTGYDPVTARRELNAAKGVHRRKNYGEEWSEEKGRMTGGTLERLYDRDEEKEEPKQGTREYRIWQYGQTFVEATDPKTGELDFDKLNKLQGRFWGSLGYRIDPTTRRRVNEVDEMLESIRLIEGDFDPRMQNLVDAGRYGSSFTMSLANQNIRYYDLDKHKSVLAYIVSVTEEDVRTIEKYIDMSEAERDAFRKSLRGDRIGTAFGKAYRKNGILWQLRKAFVNNAPAQWRQAMYEAGFSYQGQDAIQERVFAKLRAGTPHPRLDYKRLYRGTLIRQ